MDNRKWKILFWRLLG